MSKLSQQKNTTTTQQFTALKGRSPRKYTVIHESYTPYLTSKKVSRRDRQRQSVAQMRSTAEKLFGYGAVRQMGRYVA